jgi:capping protein alpha
VYTFDPSTNELSGEIKVDVHYYEDGNVRLLTTNTLEVVEIPGGSAVEVVKTIAKKEKEYQEKLNDAFGQLSEGAFKNLRRQLPITRQKVDWDKIGSYRLGQQVGLFPTHEHS